MSSDETKGTKRKEQVVYQLVKISRCYNCDTKLDPGSIVKFSQGGDEREVLCTKCAQLEGLEFLPTGNAKVTQLAKKYSGRTFVVVKWSELWKTYERQGLLVEPNAIDRAEKETGKGP